MARTLTLVPSAAAARDLLASRVGSEAIPGDSAATFSSLSRRLVEAHYPLRIPSPTERLGLALLAGRAAGLNLAPRAAGAFAATLGDLHASGVSSAQLGRLGAESRRLGVALENHQRLLKANALCDVRALPRLAARALREKAPPTFLPFESVEVTPRPSFTQAELDLCAALAERAEVVVQLPYDAERKELFSPLNAVDQELARIGGRVRVEAVVPASISPERSELAPALRTLFSSETQIDARLHAFSAGSPEAEAREVVVLIRELLREGVLPDRIAVASWREFPHAVGQALRAAGIAMASAPRRTLKSTPPGQLALALLRLCELGIPRDGVCQLLAAGQLALTKYFVPGGKGSRAAAQWVRALREEGCGDQRSGTLLPPLRLWVAHHQGQHAGELAALEAAIAQIEKLPEEGTLGEHAKALWDVMQSIGPKPSVTRNVAKRSRGTALQMNLLDVPKKRRWEPIPVLLWSAADADEARERLQAVVSDLVRLEKAPGSRALLDRAAFAGFLDVCLEQEEARSVTPGTGGVILTDVASLIGREVDHLFLVGLSEDRGEGEDLWLDDGLRALISRELERPAALPPSGVRAAQGRRDLAFVLACDTASSSITASHSRVDGEGTPNEPSAQFKQLAQRSKDGAIRLAFSARPKGASCLTRAEALCLDPEARDALSTGGPLAVELAGLRAQTREREAAIIEGRADPHSGGLYAPDVLVDLAERLAFSPEKPASPSRLDKLAGCGFRGFAEYVLKLHLDRDRGDWIDPREEGTLFHRCLEEAFTGLRAEGLLPLQGGERRAREQAVFASGVRAALDAHEREAATGHPLVWAAFRRKTERQLMRVYAAELIDGEGFVPTAFELEFGTPETPAIALTLDDGAIAWIGGKIDRLDERGEELRIVDYKRGSIEKKKRRLKLLLGRQDLQLPMYAWLVSSRRGRGTADALYLSVEKAARSKPLSKYCEEAGIDLETFLGPPAPDVEDRPPVLASTLRRVIGRARAGQLPVVPGDCAFCPLTAACRVGARYEELDD
jgi:RecB family exonuclease